jgi:hypothetical protein
MILGVVGFSVLFGFVSVSGIISQRRNNIIGRYFPTITIIQFRQLGIIRGIC